MSEITIKEYADSRGKSVQSVYQQLKGKRTNSIISSHIKEKIVNNKKTKVLDDVAIKILDEASNTSVQILEENNKQKEYEEAIKQVNSLKEENDKLKNLLVSIQNKLIDTQTLLIEEPKKTQDLYIELNSVNKENQDLKDEIIKLKEELNNEKNKSFWSKLFNK